MNTRPKQYVTNLNIKIDEERMAWLRSQVGAKTNRAGYSEIVREAIDILRQRQERKQRVNAMQM